MTAVPVSRFDTTFCKPDAREATMAAMLPRYAAPLSAQRVQACLTIMNCSRALEAPNALTLQGMQEDKLPVAGGVEFSVQPPGKRYGVATSGGEDSIAALALLLAAQRYSRAPFFVFDEVRQQCQMWPRCGCAACCTGGQGGL